MTHTFICPGCEQTQPHAAALAEHTRTCNAYRAFIAYDDAGTCLDCGRPLDDEYICPGCHHESGCRCPG